MLETLLNLVRAVMKLAAAAFIIVVLQTPTT